MNTYTYTHLVPRSRSSAMVKVKCRGHVSQKMGVSGALVFHKHILFFLVPHCFQKYFFSGSVGLGGYVFLSVLRLCVLDTLLFHRMLKAVKHSVAALRMFSPDLVQILLDQVVYLMCTFETMKLIFIVLCELVMLFNLFATQS